MCALATRPAGLCRVPWCQVGLFMDFMKERSIAASQVHTRNDLHPCVAEFKPPSGEKQGLSPKLPAGL